MGANFLSKSTDRGNSWTTISPDLTGGAPGSITTIAESPLRAGLLYVGTDDGHVQVSRDGGKSWKNLTGHFPGMPGRRWVSRVVASRFDEATAYVTFDGHRNDDYSTYVFKTSDYGETWTSIRANLPPREPVKVIREDYKNRNLLFLGTEFAAYVTIDGGASWTRFMSNMPTVRVADLAIHPRDADLIAGTHGRSIYVVDISPLQQLTETVLSSSVHLFNPKPAMAFQYRVFSDDQFLGEKRFVAANPPYGATISYYLKSDVSDEVKLTIMDTSGNVVRELAGSKERGIHRIQWDLRYAPPPRAEAAGGGGGGFGGPLQGPLVDPGQYMVRLSVGSRQWTTSVTVEPDPMLEITEAERRTWRTTITRLLRIQSTAVSAVNAANTLHEQLAGLSKTVADFQNASAGLRQSMQETARQVADLQGKIRRASGQITGLYQEVNAAPFAPTETQTRVLEELTRELDSLVTALNSAIGAIPNLENQMNRENVPRLKPVQPVGRGSN